MVHDENSLYDSAAFAWLEPNGDVREVGPMIVVARIEPTHVAMIRTLVAPALDYIHIAMEDAGKALLAEVQAMTLETRNTLPKGISFDLPTEDDIKNTR